MIQSNPTSSATPSSLTEGADWQLSEHSEVTSTNLCAADLPAWNALRADKQTAGRGRFQRRWVSDEGGLWLSAVVPAETNTPEWRILPLVAGTAVCETLHQLGVCPIRMRWPNDVLVEHRKLAGLLIDQFHPGRAIVGIGLNVHNHPEKCDKTLNGHVARLADLITPPAITEIACQILAKLKTYWQSVLVSGPASFLPHINALWALPRQVRLDLDGSSVTGDFYGVDESGRLQLGDATGHTRSFSPNEVRQLRELT